MNHRLDTRRLYAFEEKFFRGSKQLPIGKLKLLAARIWKREGIRRPLPPIVAGKGMRYLGRYYSYFDGKQVVLARSERRAFVLIHELVHAMGFDYHNSSFVERYFELLFRYHKQGTRGIINAARSHKVL